MLDTDTYNEIDDQFALVQAILSPERIKLEAIYAAPFFNDRSSGPGEGMELSYGEILALLERLDVKPDGLVYPRRDRLCRPRRRRRSRRQRVDDLIARARSASTDDPLYVIAIGAISNVASALIKAPDIIDRTVVVWLGGNALDWPNQKEFNLKQDIGGTQVLFDSGVPLVHPALLGRRLASAFDGPGDRALCRACMARSASSSRCASRNMPTTIPAGPRRSGTWRRSPWLIDDNWTPSVLVPTPIMTDNMTYSIDRGRPLMRYVTYVDRNPIMQDFIRQAEEARRRLSRALTRAAPARFARRPPQKRDPEAETCPSSGQAGAFRIKSSRKIKIVLCTARCARQYHREAAHSPDAPEAVRPLRRQRPSLPQCQERRRAPLHPAAFIFDASRECFSQMAPASSGRTVLRP